jgi:molecular chaperone DnaJ
VPDYYAVLGVDREATQDEIKKAFRKLARETHPDSNGGDAEAEHRFREVAEAYEVLGDPARRASYDRGGSFDPNDLFSSFGGIDEVLSRFFGGGGFPFGSAQRGPTQGDDIGVATSITLAEAAAGVEREVTYRARVSCATCSGSGSAPGVGLAMCERCSGQGSLRVTRQTLLGTTMSIVACDQCAGRGKTVVEPCGECRGGGSIADEVTVSVTIPPGVDDGARMRLTGRGQAGDPGGRAGDLYVQIGVEPDPRFSRHGADLIHRVTLGLSEAVLGTEVAVPTIDSDPVPIDVPAGTQPGTVFKLSRQGMPRLQRRGRGDLLVEVVVAVPDEIDTVAEDALRSYGEAMGESPAAKKRGRRKR